MASGELLTCLIQLCHTTVLTSHSVVVSLGCGEGTDGGTAQQTGMRFNGDSSLFLHQTTRNFFLSFVASWHAQLTCHPCKLCKPYKCGNQCKHQGLPMNAAVFTRVDAILHGTFGAFCPRDVVTQGAALCKALEWVLFSTYLR